ncbi:response regulator transcription factor [Thiorhodococcus minor]|uniref:Response regulator transcription factor n=1 Tax=Thiorhodococcus minor TaxID=57489 RepID=A0A6M0JX37_9GAMM|nr:response regulator transcription factor [Thiorhodococcus minor]NEV61183.1 response regulator transcription factor [Thiorhodococcus minor]
MNVLIIEDEPELRRQILDRFVATGWRAEGTGDGPEGLYLATEYAFDAAVVDLGLPGMSGLEIIRRLRAQQSLLPILILTARDRWQDKVEGLEAGADDYLVKPFHQEELIARLRALTRRAAGTASRELRVGPLRIDLNTEQVWVDEREIELTAYEYRLIEQLATSGGKVLSKQALADHLYPHDEDRESNVIEVLVGRLRRKLDPKGELSPIETLRGRGYRLSLGSESGDGTGK